MNIWNAMYLLLAAGVFSTLLPAAWPLIAMSVVPVLLLWAGRWISDRARSRKRSDVMADSGYTPMQERDAIAEVLGSLNPALRDWVMQGYPTGSTQYWVRDAWCAERQGVLFTAMEVQTTPGYMGTGIPVWRVRHRALLVHSPREWVTFSLWRDPGSDNMRASAAEVNQRRSVGKDHHLWPMHGFMVRAADPERACDQFLSVWQALGEQPDGDLFATAVGQDLVIFWRKQPPSGLWLRQVLDRCVASSAG